jgi:hypothetical protein
MRLSSRASLVLIGGLLLAGCGFGSSTPTTTSTSTSTSTTTTTTIPATSTSTTTTAIARCSTGVLNASASSGGIAAGSAYETFSVTNTGPATCAVSGFANLALFGASGAGGAGAGPRLAVTVTDTTASPATLTLATRSTAAFSMRYSDEPVGGVGCDTVASAEISLPGSAESLTFPVSLTVCGGSVEIGPFGPPGSQTP